MEISTPLIVGFVGSFLLLGILTLTAFVKISVVFMILRNAIGLQQVPSNMVVMLLAMFLAIFISVPVISEALSELSTVSFQDATLPELLDALNRGIVPFQNFIVFNTAPSQLAFFVEIADKVWEGSGFTGDPDLSLIHI